MTIRSRGIREEDDGHAELATGLDIDRGSLHPVAKEGIGNGQEKTSAGAGPMIRGHGPPMADTIQRCEGGVDNSSAGSPSSVSDETDPAGVVLEPRVVQARVPQFEVSTLSPVGAPHHGRFNQKNGPWSYLRYKTSTESTAAFAAQVATLPSQAPGEMPERTPRRGKC